MLQKQVDLFRGRFHARALKIYLDTCHCDSLFLEWHGVVDTEVPGIWVRNLDHGRHGPSM
jgi:hypothetical protein